MRLNKFLAQNTSLSRRKADQAIADGRVSINGTLASLGDEAQLDSVVELDNNQVQAAVPAKTVLAVNKPVGYVCSRNGQGSPSLYDLLPAKYQRLEIAGRLDKDSSGLVIMTNDGDLLHELTHPSNHKKKVYLIITDRRLTNYDLQQLRSGVDIGDERPSVMKVKETGDKTYEIILSEGRNRQIRRSIKAINRSVIKLRRTKLANFTLGQLRESSYEVVI